MSADLTRREILAAAATLGIGSPTFHRALAAVATAQPRAEPITPELVRSAEWVAGITLTEAERRAVATGLNATVPRLLRLRAVPVGYDPPPAVHFTPTPAEPPRPAGRGTVTPTRPDREPAHPAADADLAFLPVHHLAELIRTKKISSTELTKLYLARLKKYDPVLRCVITLTEELGLNQAAAADKEIAAGRYRGPLHGIPWVAKDLIAYPGYKTTWGAAHFKEQQLETRATVAERLDAAGAVLLAKVSLGALAWGDQWFGGQTRNPWDVTAGSSGSSAGTAAAVAAGLTAFGLGSETLGSIVSPCRVCGVTGLRPTFGRVSRYGCMPLCWSLDKIGPMARCVEDCALVLGAIHGPDGHDPTVHDRPFAWPGERPLKELRVGVIDEPGGTPEPVRAVLREVGVKLVPVRLPGLQLAAATIGVILDVEAAAAFDDLTRAGISEGIGLWPTTFRKGRFVSAVDYLRAQRVRTLLMREMARLFEQVDCYAGGEDLALANLTGHPTVCLPSGFRPDGTPTAVTFTGRPFGEPELLTVAKAYQDATGFHLKRPPEDTWLKKD